MCGEIWKDIPGYEGIYQVSTLGRVKSLDHVVVQCWGKGASERTYKGRLIKPCRFKKKRAYVYVDLSKDGRVLRFSVHKLVLTTFVGPCPDGMVACHFPDPNPENNCLNNLRWDTRSANEADKEIHGTRILAKTSA